MIINFLNAGMQLEILLTEPEHQTLKLDPF
jgi:hypothetical protein